MSFELIDLEHWERKEHYLHYINQVVCSYSLTANIDITRIKEERLYPAMLWLLTDTVNEMKEFRTSISSEGIGRFDSMHPSYTIFNKQRETFSVIWTEFDSDYRVFLSRYEEDCKKYSVSDRFTPKPDKPINTFDVSMIPWTTFSSFNLNIENAGNYLLPIFTIGKYFAQEGKINLPLAIQIHHAACDGYHVGVFLEKLQDKIMSFKGTMC